MKRGRFAAEEQAFEGTYDEPNGVILDKQGREYRLDEVRFLPPCRPSKILCVGLNYREALDARQLQAPAEPLIRVMKPASCLIGHKETIIKPDWANDLFFEGEMGIVIGRSCRRVKASQFADVVAGYTVFNDVGVRDFPPISNDPQARIFTYAQLVKAKGSDTFGPIGPWIEDEIDPTNLRLHTYVNGDLKQDSTTANMVFDVPFLIEYITSFMTLEPGDLISSGTTTGVGAINPGDTIRIEIEGIGTLENSVRDEA